MTTAQPIQLTIIELENKEFKISSKSKQMQLHLDIIPVYEVSNGFINLEVSPPSELARREPEQETSISTQRIVCDIVTKAQRLE